MLKLETQGALGNQSRLRRIFRRALWIALATPVAAPFACGDAPLPTTKPASNQTNSTALSSGSGDPSDAGPDTDTDADTDADIFGGPQCDPVSYEPTPADDCGAYVHLPCGLPAGVVPGAGGGCFFLLKDCNKFCPSLFWTCHAATNSCDAGVVTADPTGNIDIDCDLCAGGVGRVPAGLAPAEMARSRSAIGDWFAVTAHLEAASVHAFRRLGDELAAHRAPSRLVRRARSAERDEIRHARMTSRMAKRFGGAPAHARVKHLPTRDLDTIAIENAVEGCIRETFGALIATFQAGNAADPEIAEMMRTVARDETRHATLSWAIAEWAWQKLDHDARTGLVARCREAVATLHRECDKPIDGLLASRAGLPTPEQRRALVAVLEADLWTAFAIAG